MRFLNNTFLTVSLFLVLFSSSPNCVVASEADDVSISIAVMTFNEKTPFLKLQDNYDGKLYCYPSRTEPKGKQMKLSKRFQKMDSNSIGADNGKQMEAKCEWTAQHARDSELPNGEDSNWHAFYQRYSGIYDLAVNTSFGTNCTSHKHHSYGQPLRVNLKEANFYRHRKNTIKNNKIPEIYGKPRVIEFDCGHGKSAQGNESKEKFDGMQLEGAFLADFNDLWLLFFDMVPCGNETGMMFYNIPTEPPIYLPKISVKCDPFEEPVRPAMLPEGFVVRAGFIYNEAFEPFKLNGTDYIVEPYQEEFKLGIRKELNPEHIKLLNFNNPVGRNNNNDSHFYAKLNGHFIYKQLPAGFVSKENGLVKMYFMRCNNVTIGLFAMKVDPNEELVVRPENDWSTDFDNVTANCSEWATELLDEEKHKYLLHMFEPDGYYEKHLTLHPKTQPKIGVVNKVQDGSYKKAEVDALLYYNCLNPEPHWENKTEERRPNCREELNDYQRTSFWGRFLAGREKMYERAKEFPLLSVTYRVLHRGDIQQFWFIKLEDLEPLKLNVTPVLWQQWYECKDFDVHTSRFRATQLMDGFEWEGELLKPKYDHATLGFEVEVEDRNGQMKWKYIYVPKDLSKYDLAKNFEDGNIRISEK